MKPKRRRLYFVALGLLILAAAAALALTALQDNVVFFYSPTEIAEKKIPPGQRIRLGGLVLENSIKKQADGVTTEFGVTDRGKTVVVVYKGILPDLFREAQGVVVQGALRPDGVFVANEVLAKHDETYMPPEVAEALKKQGVWKEPKPK
ncbi:MAG: cytochrome c maturation protein CcmE [Alphaproteobacteria bacterium]